MSDAYSSQRDFQSGTWEAKPGDSSHGVRSACRETQGKNKQGFQQELHMTPCGQAQCFIHNKSLPQALSGGNPIRSWEDKHHKAVIEAVWKELREDSSGGLNRRGIPLTRRWFLRVAQDGQ